MYYLQSRYYRAEFVRFVNADIYVSTGQGLLDSNMFAYCQNNPVVRNDAAGTNPLERLTDDGDTRPGDDLKANHGRCPGGSGGSTWSAFISTLQSAAYGLTMPLGRINMAMTENHHILTNKNKTYTPRITEITDKYGMSLNGKENIVPLPGHKGRHTNAYHEAMLLSLEQLDAYANGDIAIFMEGMGEMGKFLLEYYWLPYGK